MGIQKIKMSDYINIPKGAFGYALLTTSSQPNIFIPIQVKIIDLKYNKALPTYICQITKFFDDFNFVKENVINCNLRYAKIKDNNVITAISPCKLRQYKDITTLDEVYDILLGNIDVQKKVAFGINKNHVSEYKDFPNRHYVIIECLFVYDSIDKMKDAYKHLTEYEINRMEDQLEKNRREITAFHE